MMPATGLDALTTGGGFQGSSAATSTGGNVSTGGIVFAAPVKGADTKHLLIAGVIIAALLLVRR